MVLCKHCGAELGAPTREWDMHPTGLTKQSIHVRHYVCGKCGKRSRYADKIIFPPLGQGHGPGPEDALPLAA